jgi:flagellum-specific peptidoglycan hydrolase FlgJ
MNKEIRIPVLLMLIALVGVFAPATKIEQTLKLPEIKLTSLISPPSVLSFPPPTTSVSLVPSIKTKTTKTKAATAIVVANITAAAKKNVSRSTTLASQYLKGWIHQVSRSGNPVTDTQRFVVTAIPTALKTEKKYGVPAAFLLSQAIYESGHGTSRLAVVGHNYFGVTYQGHGTPIYIDGIAYQRFANMAASFDQQGDMLTDPSHGYQSALKYKKDVYKYAQQVQQLGYCPSTCYGAMIKTIVEDFALEAK